MLRLVLRSRLLSAVTLGLLLSLLVVPTPVHAQARRLVGPKAHYLALGDSLAYGYQPDLNFSNGYDTVFGNYLHNLAGTDKANLACAGETSVTMVNGGCPAGLIRKYPYIGSQLNAALFYIYTHRGQVSPVTLDIGANDVLPDIDKKTCTINTGKFASDLAAVDANLKNTILPKLQAALTVNNSLTGDLLVMNYFDSYQNQCPNTVPYVQQLNEHIAADIAGFGTLVDVFSAFGGAAVPNPNTCSYTWICSIFNDIHAKNIGYRVIAQRFEDTAGY